MTSSTISPFFCRTSRSLFNSMWSNSFRKSHMLAYVLYRIFTENDNEPFTFIRLESLITVSRTSIRTSFPSSKDWKRKVHKKIVTNLNESHFIRIFLEKRKDWKKRILREFESYWYVLQEVLEVCFEHHFPPQSSAIFEEFSASKSRLFYSGIILCVGRTEEGNILVLVFLSNLCLLVRPSLDDLCDKFVWPPWVITWLER